MGKHLKNNRGGTKRMVKLISLILLLTMLLTGCSLFQTHRDIPPATDDQTQYDDLPVIDDHTHQYNCRVIDEKYRVVADVNCQGHVAYYMSCSCGEIGEETFLSEQTGAHNFSKEISQLKYLKAEATLDRPEEYYKSCELCGAVGTETFFKGSKLREYTDQEKVHYTPTSLTVTLYDTSNSTYGFTYNTKYKPLRPVIQIAEGDDLTDYKEYYATVEKATSYRDDDEKTTYYIVKAEVQLEGAKTYSYRAYDKYVGVGTGVATLQTKDLTSGRFTFAHISDSQMTKQTGKNFGKVLSKITDKCDFIVHTGDIVESSKYESEWKAMLHDNFAYLSQIPMMAISGNHETSYKNGSNEIYKHFHNSMPEQSTDKGYYYSFVYGNAKFIMLNTNRLTGTSLTQDQYDWLVKELKSNTATWTIVALHNPLYSAGKYGSNPDYNSISVGLRTQLQKIFAEYGVDIVLQGHDHLVSRTLPIDGNGKTSTETWQTVNGIRYTVDPNGVLYVMNGPAGDQTRAKSDYAKSALYDYIYSSKACSWAELEIDGNRLTVTVKYTDGSTVSEYCKWGILKTK